jgi:iron complex outermembrane receptor protein
MLPCAVAFSQARVTGTVRTAGEPVAGASVVVQGTFQGTYSNAGGDFDLGTISRGKHLVEVSFLGLAKETLSIEVTDAALVLEVVMKPRTFVSDEVIISATRASGKSPIAYSEVSKAELNRNNLGQDLPILLNYLPSVVTTSDAGNGIGYTGLRVRGSDATRVNVSINGIPVNDAESQGTFFVDLPDLGSSLQSVQLQRGVGTSANGAGAFGASLNLATNDISQKPYGEISNSFGSFNSRKHTVSLGSGLINDHFYIEGRLSRIHSDGYIDRARTDLQSYYLQGAYTGKRSLLKVLAFGGTEETYQAWYGLDSASMVQSRTRNFAGEKYDADYNVTGTYDNQVDHYTQDHYQLHYSYSLSSHLTANASLHYTYGRGYYEEYIQGAALADYGINPVITGSDTIISTDLVRRRWLDNDFYGLTYSLAYQEGRLGITLGGGYNIYDGRHFGEVNWARFAGDSEVRHRFYESTGEKKDFNTYTRANYSLDKGWNAYADLQVRTVSQVISGMDNGFVPLGTAVDLSFFNPKAGIAKQLTPTDKLFVSYGIAHREPNRSDYINAPAGKLPSPEKLADLEAGYKRNTRNYAFELNYFLMNYSNQLVLTGAVDDVGAFVRSNSGKSYRTGIELQLMYKVSSKVNAGGNFTFSSNRNVNYIRQNSDSTTVSLGSTPIAYSPSATGALQLEYLPVKGLSLALLNKYVGEQYLDNEENASLKLAPYFVSDLRIIYTCSALKLKNVSLSLLVNNIFNAMYSSNGYVYGSTAYYYPQAGRYFLAGLKLSF